MTTAFVIIGILAINSAALWWVVYWQHRAFEAILTERKAAEAVHQAAEASIKYLDHKRREHEDKINTLRHHKLGEGPQ